MSKNGRFRKKENNYTMVHNNILKNVKLSLKAKGLYSLIQSYITAPNFTLYKSFLIKQNTDGEKSFNNGWKELQESGYLIQYKMKDKEGVFYYEYELLDEPIIPEDEDENDKNKTDKSKKLIKKVNEIRKNNNIKKNSGPSESEQYSQSIQTPVSQVWKTQAWKREAYNNTDSNKTYKNNTTKQQQHINNTYSVKNNEVETVVVVSDEEIENVKEVITRNLNTELNKKDLRTIAIELKKNNINTLTLENACDSVKNSNKKIKNLTGFILSAIKNNYTSSEYKNVITQNNSDRATTNSNSKELAFKNFDERVYNYDVLEKQLLGWDNE